MRRGKGDLFILFILLVSFQIGVSRDPVHLANSSVAIYEAVFALLSLFVAFFAISKIVSLNKAIATKREKKSFIYSGVIYLVVLLEATTFLVSATTIGKVVRIHSDGSERIRVIDSLSQSRLLVEASNTFGLEFPLNSYPFYWIDGTKSEIKIAKSEKVVLDRIIFSDEVFIDFFLAPCIDQARISILLAGDLLEVELNIQNPVKRMALGNIEDDLDIVVLIDSPTCEVPGDGRTLSVGFSRPHYE